MQAAPGGAAAQPSSDDRGSGARPDGPRQHTGRKVALSAVALAAAAAVATHGTSAAFTASATRGHMITTGTPSLGLGTTGAATNRLGVDVPDMAPGDVAQRSFDLTNTGTRPFTSFTFTSVATAHSLLDTDATNGLQITLKRCPAAWAETGASPNFTYTCSGTPVTLVSGRVVQSAVPLTGMVSAAAGGTDHLLLTETLPTTADNSFTGLTSALTFTFNAT